MRIACLSDLHGHLPEVPDCDLLVIAGDLGPPTPGYHHGWQAGCDWLTCDFADWLRTCGAPAIVGIAGNHDFIARDHPQLMHDLPWTYLCDEGATVGGLKCWGSPYTPNFFDWAFMEDEPRLEQRWSRIPQNTDLLITHGPPHAVLDINPRGQHCGSATLAARLNEITPRLHVFGHIHGPGGRTQTLSTGTRCVNASLVNESYEPAHAIQVIDL